MKFLVSLLVVFLVVVVNAQAIVFTRCELAIALLEDGMAMELLPDWVCLVESESGRNSSAVGGPNKNGSYDFGLFQINNRWWCTIGKPGGGCDIDCDKLIDDDISDDVVCAKKIYKSRKFEAWNGWKAKCQNKPLPDLTKCFTKLNEC